uniref:DDE Tnp4 domain-containing protein n=1 Tax=Brugia timori TaxID=42155 RepID=A0A0R3QL09_9BILA
LAHHHHCHMLQTAERCVIMSICIWHCFIFKSVTDFSSLTDPPHYLFFSKMFEVCKKYEFLFNFSLRG